MSRNPGKISLGVSILLACLYWVNLSAFAEPTAPRAKAEPRAQGNPTNQKQSAPTKAETPTTPRTRGTSASAKDTKSGKPASDQENFAPVDLSKRPVKAGWDRPYLLAAYGVVWLILLIYLLSLARRLSSTDARLEALEQHVKELSPED